MHQGHWREGKGGQSAAHEAKRGRNAAQNSKDGGLVRGYDREGATKALRGRKKPHGCDDAGAGEHDAGGEDRDGEEDG